MEVRLRGDCKWCVIVVLGILLSSEWKWNPNAEGFHGSGSSNYESKYGAPAVVAPPPPNALMVNLTLIQGADAKGAVCLDGTLPGYHLYPGFGKGASSWLVTLEGGGWCNNVTSCLLRTKINHGSSNYFEAQLPFTGILSNNASENPDLCNWNKVKIRYCDGASFAGEGEIKSKGLKFRGQRIWQVAIEEIMSKGMRNASQALLTGCSAGALAAILHCDEFRDLFPSSTKVKCVSDAGLFMDSIDVSGGRTLRKFFNQVVTLQGVEKNLPTYCTDHLDPTLCFFPQNIIANIKTPLFLLNSGYDTWQIQESLAPPSADPMGEWRECRLKVEKCSASQIKVLQDFGSDMLNAIKEFEASEKSGLFIHSCFIHCHAEAQYWWFVDHTPAIHNKAMATAVGDWYFDRACLKEIDSPYPCNKSCPRIP